MAGTEAGDLAADLRADGAAGPGDEDAVTFERPANPLKVGRDRGPAQEVLDARFAGPADGKHAGRALHHVVHGRQHLHGDSG